MINLETIPLSEVPKGGVFICKTYGAYQVYWKRNRITEADIPLYDAYRSYLVYSTRTGKTNLGMNYYIEGKVQVAYTGIIFKDRRE